MADAVCRYLQVEEEINEAVDRLVDAKREVLRTIERLEVEEYDVLHKLYVQGKTFQEVAEEKAKSYSWVTSKHGRALANLQKILEEKGR